MERLNKVLRGGLFTGWLWEATGLVEETKREMECEKEKEKGDDVKGTMGMSRAQESVPKSTATKETLRKSTTRRDRISTDRDWKNREGRLRY